MIRPMSDKEWAKIKAAAREPVFSESSIIMGRRKCCSGCNALPCTVSCPIQYALTQRKLEIAASKPIATTNIIIEGRKRKTIPKKIRGEAWKIQFGDSTKGVCYCCKKELDVFEDWHAGHIISHFNGGTDTADNLRPLCGSCNLSMGTENMDAFKVRCYP